MATYVFSNERQQGRERLESAEMLLDPGTIRHLQALGVAEGWRCLEAGAGAGSIARWLAHRVGAAGRVLATDLDIGLLEPLAGPNLLVRRHDLVRDPLDAGAFDLVHVRLVLEHLPERELVLGRLTQALAPGGWLLVEALDYASAVPVSALGAALHAHTQATRLRLMAEAGLDPAYGRVVPAALGALGLSEVGAEGRAYLMEGGSPGARWFRLSLQQLRGRLVGPDKLSDGEVDRMLALFEDPAWSALSPLTIATWGRRQAA